MINQDHFLAVISTSTTVLVVAFGLAFTLL
jgi:hypothetical protein